MKKPSAYWRRACSLIVAGVAACGSACGPAPDPTIVDRLREQTTRYPAMAIEDAYKFVHQAAFGNGHLITDETAVRQYLVSEMESVTADDKEPLIEPVSPEGSVVRVNLRPFKARGLDVTKLGDAMIESAKRFSPSPDRFERWWEQIADESARRRLPFEPAHLRAFAATQKADGYPAVHHSEVYRGRYHPAYRVVLRELVSDLVR